MSSNLEPDFKFYDFALKLVTLKVLAHPHIYIFLLEFSFLLWFHTNTYAQKLRDVEAIN